MKLLVSKNLPWLIKHSNLKALLFVQYVIRKVEIRPLISQVTLAAWSESLVTVLCKLHLTGRQEFCFTYIVQEYLDRQLPRKGLNKVLKYRNLPHAFIFVIIRVCYFSRDLGKLVTSIDKTHHLQTLGNTNLCS